MGLKNWVGPIVIVCFIFSLCPPLAANPGVNWHSFQSGMKKITDENKKGFLHFYTDRCKYCKLMNQKTFTDEAVIAFLNQNFVPIRVDASAQREIAKKYGVYRFPNSWFIAEDQSGIGKRPGFIPADTLLRMLQYIESNSFKKMSFQDFIDKNSQ